MLDGNGCVKERILVKKQNNTPEQEKFNLRINTNKFKVLPLKSAARESMFMVTAARKTSIDITENCKMNEESDEITAGCSCKEPICGGCRQNKEEKKGCSNCCAGYGDKAE